MTTSDVPVPGHSPDAVAGAAGVPIEDFEGRVAVVTGAGSGIGRGIAGSLARAGASVVVTDIDLEAAQRVASELDALAARVDVTDPDDLAKLARWVHETYGRVDIIVNNAGVGPLDEFRSLSMADIRWVMDINFWGVVHGVAAVLPYLEPLDGVTASVVRGGYDDPAAGKVTFGQWFRRWSEVQDWADGTAETATMTLASVTFADVPMSRITQLHVEAWMKAMMKPGPKRKEGLAASTRRTRYNYVRMALGLRDGSRSWRVTSAQNDATSGQPGSTTPADW